MKKTIKGQITIFMALIFMVIFSLFMMTVSLSMFIHDKINVQNATDLASYYVASKQAELLGAIAHNNYAIRQSFKLLSYRYRVYGNAGRTDSSVVHPGNRAGWSSFIGNRTIYTPSVINTAVTPPIPPRVCIGSSHILQEVNSDNQCRNLNFSVNYLNSVGSVVGSLVGGINAGVVVINQNIADRCEKVAYLNWYYSNAIVGAHKYEQRDRRAIIEALAVNLARPIQPGDDGMRDIDGGNIYEGARKTFFYNLTESNREVLRQSPNAQTPITVVNSLQGIDPSAWLSPIFINIVIPYSHFITNGGCRETLRNHTDTAVNSMTRPEVLTLKAALDPTGGPQGNMAFFGGYPGGAPSDLNEVLSMGVEKNPWFMVYNKTEASIFSRPLFLGSFIAPEGIRINAISYAKPFGGRIGPWDRQIWPQGSDRSSTGNRTDPVAPNRVTLAEYGTNMNNNDPTIYPNYSRFPSDQNGVTTNEAMVHAGPIVGWDWNDVGTPGFQTATSIQDYFFVTHSYHSPDYNDPLAQDVSQPDANRWNSFNRRLEIAAIVPDAFDLTYYSISPNYYDYYIEEQGRQKLSSWLTPQGDGIEIRGDIGSHPGQLNFSVADQMNNYSTTGSLDSAFIRGSFNVVRRREDIAYFNTDGLFDFLTAWNKGETPMSYDAPTNGNMNNFFATCLTALRDVDPSNSKPRVPSGCLRGGRFGYSVKLISGDYVRDEHPIGGQRTTGSIENPL